MSCQRRVNRQVTRVLPWGEEVYLEIPLHERGSAHKFYARHGKTSDGREYVEFSKFGIAEGSENQTYSQKLRLYNREDWQRVVGVTDELLASIGWL